MKTFVSLLLVAIGVNLVFATILYFFFHRQISGAHTYTDYVYYSIGSLTTSEIGNMVPQTTAVKLLTGLYVLSAWVYIFYVTINHITSIRVV